MSLKHTMMIIIMMMGSTQTLSGETTPGRPTELYLATPHHGCIENRELRTVDCYKQWLDSVPQYLPEDIKGLNLKRNNITSLLSTSFMRYPLITELCLSDNDISVIEYTTFYPLSELIQLNLSFNLNEKLVLPTTDLFRWASKLSYLQLVYSNLKSIPNDTLKWSRNFATLNLRRNLLTFINISVCDTVEHVDLSNNNIKHLTVETFNFGCHIDTLSLTSNPLKSVDPNVIASLQVRSLVFGNRNRDDSFSVDVLKDIFIGISRSHVIQAFTLRYGYHIVSAIPIDFFDPLRDYSLTMLDLSNSELHDLYPFVFSSLTGLSQLNLSRNDIVTIEPSFFEGMRELRILNLNLNKVKYINTYNLSWTIGLTELYLRDNYLTTIKAFTFRGLHNLKLLDVRSNEFLSAVYFNDLKSIQNIDLSSCNIVNLELILPSLTTIFLNENEEALLFTPYTPFRNTRALQHLDFRKSELMLNDIWNLDNNVSLFDGLFNLKTLDLSINHLNNLKRASGVFRQLSALESLALEACELTNIHPSIFAELESLYVLVLRSNQMHQLHIHLFKELDQITSIDLANNLLVDLDKVLFSNNPNLTTLLLSNNRLTRLDHNTFSPIYSSLSSIDLSANPIVCDCDLSWLLDWLHGSLQLVQNEDFQINCSLASLEPFREKHLLDFDPNELCGTNITLVCLTSLAVISLILIIAIGYHNRWQLRYKLFLVKLAAVGYKEIRDARDHNDYEFDLNVMFYDDDEEWIREHLRPALEEQLPQFQRNLFGDNDLVLGMHYLDSVDYVVSHSYKTVIVLSRAAVRDRWFMLKFRTAMDHVSDTQTEFVVVVFLEDIPDEEIPFLARLYLSDGRPYVYWPDDMRGHEYFFDELTKHLTINLRTNDLIPNE